MLPFWSELSWEIDLSELDLSHEIKVKQNKIKKKKWNNTF